MVTCRRTLYARDVSARKRNGPHTTDLNTRPKLGVQSNAVTVAGRHSFRKSVAVGFITSADPHTRSVARSGTHAHAVERASGDHPAPGLAFVHARMVLPLVLQVHVRGVWSVPSSYCAITASG